MEYIYVSPVCVTDVSQFPIQNRLKQWDRLLTSLFNFALKYAIRIVEKNHRKCNWMRHASYWYLYGGDNLLGETLILQRKAPKLNSALVRSRSEHRDNKVNFMYG
jgi:hypothetical protein